MIARPKIERDTGWGSGANELPVMGPGLGHMNGNTTGIDNRGEDQCGSYQTPNRAGGVHGVG